eukprot:TRINITY_DN3254_c0_g1_i3.p1 TRINITY_DN3254_c0_g1~~TRINITY_DN3254_c0_g1_i3.p1  ORF type:complete len:405 (+),score=97.54 TRINITY_DN3254_c0_g1_i3:170-1384(+)
MQRTLLLKTISSKFLKFLSPSLPLFTLIPFTVFKNPNALIISSLSTVSRGTGEVSPPKVDRKTKVLIIGGGPAGLTAGIYAARANLKPIIAMGDGSGNNVPGGQLMITTEVENYPGYEHGIQGPELMDKMIAQAKRFGADLIPAQAKEFLPFVSGGPFFVKTGKEWIEAECLILANGSSARWLDLPNEDKFRNRGISACATCDGPLPMYRNKHLFVVGGGDSAMEEALFLTRFASQVTILHRRDKFRASKIMQERLLSNPKVQVKWNTEVAGYEGKERLSGLVLKDTKTGQTWKESEVGGLFMAIGHTPNTNSLKGTGIELDDEGYVAVSSPKGEKKDNLYVYTNVPGVFAAGDVHDKKFKQAITAAGFGCMSAIAAERWLEAKHSNTLPLSSTPLPSSYNAPQ